MQKNSYPYPVEIVEDVFGESPVLADMIKKQTGCEKPRVYLVADMNVVQRTEGLGLKIGRWAQAHDISLVGAPSVLPGGEKIKCDDQVCVRMTEGRILKAGIGAGDLVLAIGGGSLLDVAGCAASHVRGGVPIVRVPTSVPAMIDAAFADMAAVNVAGSKDAIRVKSVPVGVVIDPAFAMSVLEGVWRSGCGEALRFALASDATLVKKLAALLDPYLARDPAALREMIGLTVASRLKKGSTNFGLWSALRLEGLSGYKLPHGCAVPIGMCIDMRYALLSGILKEKDYDYAFDLLSRGGLIDSLVHSRHLLSQRDAVLQGLDHWKMSAGVDDIALPCGIGKTKPTAEFNRDLYATAFKELAECSIPR